jgi:hypothetical protein
VGGGWALEIETFLGPLKWHPAVRRKPFGAHIFISSFVKDLVLRLFCRINLWVSIGCSADTNNQLYLPKYSNTPALSVLVFLFSSLTLFFVLLTPHFKADRRYFLTGENIILILQTATQLIEQFKGIVK